MPGASAMSKRCKEWADSYTRRFYSRGCRRFARSDLPRQQCADTTFETLRPPLSGDTRRTPRRTPCSRTTTRFHPRPLPSPPHLIHPYNPADTRRVTRNGTLNLILTMADEFEEATAFVRRLTGPSLKVACAVDGSAVGFKALDLALGFMVAGRGCNSSTA